MDYEHSVKIKQYKSKIKTIATYRRDYFDSELARYLNDNYEIINSGITPINEITAFCWAILRALY
jgi:hypothetical protein